MSDPVKDLKAEVLRLRKIVAKLRNAVGPFACLGRNELRSGDFNRARRAMAEQEDRSHE